jgi:hypothetical protein
MVEAADCFETSEHFYNVVPQNSNQKSCSLWDVSPYSPLKANRHVAYTLAKPETSFRRAVASRSLIFAVQKGLKQRDALSPLLLNFDDTQLGRSETEIEGHTLT